MLKMSILHTLIKDIHYRYQMNLNFKKSLWSNIIPTVSNSLSIKKKQKSRIHQCVFTNELASSIINNQFTRIDGQNF